MSVYMRVIHTNAELFNSGPPPSVPELVGDIEAAPVGEDKRAGACAGADAPTAIDGTTPVGAPPDPDDNSSSETECASSCVRRRSCSRTCVSKSSEESGSKKKISERT